MNLHAALHSHVVALYACVLAAVLIVAAGILSLLTWVFHRDVRTIWSIYRGWLALVPLTVGAVVLGRFPIVVLLVLLSILGVKEFARATGLYRDWWMTAALYVAILAVGATILVRDPYLGRDGWFGMFIALPVYAIALFMLIPILRNRTEGQLQAVALAILGFTYIGWMFLHLAFLTNTRNAYGYILYLLLAVELNDVAAFTFGRLLGGSGRHPLRSGISPRKTWEGAMAALCVSMALPWAMRFSFPNFGTLQLVLTGLIVGVGGQLGDLSVSVIKRDVGIKDMGTLIPGHGGVLDRIDSLIYTSPLFFHMVKYFYGIT